MKSTILVVIVLLSSSPLVAYQLPTVEITPHEWETPAEQVLNEIDPHTSKSRLAFWKTCVDLKTTLINLPPADPSANVLLESDRLAKTIITTLYRLSHEYRVLGWPRLHNLAIKMGLRTKGYCYHYTNDLRTVLQQETWNFFDFTWAEAYGGTRRESNALGLMRRGQPFITGIVVDPWRTGSRPYWHTVQGDRWPWVPRNDVVIDD